MPSPAALLLTRLAVAVGLALRAYHYLRLPPLWHDEAALVVSVLNYDFLDLLGHLPHSEAAPPLFLWLERAVVLGLGDGLYALRLTSFLASCGALLLFARLATRLLAAGPAALAVGLFAVTDRLLWHATEAKSYSLDVFVAVLAGWWLARTAGQPLWRRCLPAAVVAPLAVWLSYPACFVAGGLLVALLPAATRAGWGGRASYLTLAATVGAAFLLLVAGPAAAQRTADMDACWTDHFPRYDRPLAVPVWAVVSTFEVARYCLMPLGNALFPFAAVGLLELWKRPATRPGVVGLTTPWGLALVAALLHRYPYGAARVLVFATPAVCVLVAAGVWAAVPWLMTRGRLLGWAAVALVSVPFVTAGVRLVAMPWPRAAVDRAADVVLREHRPGDAVFANNWESEYYFRHLVGGYREWADRPLFVELAEHPPATGQALALWSARPMPDGLPGPLPPGWRVADTWAFDDVRVFRLVADAQATNSPPE